MQQSDPIVTLSPLPPSSAPSSSLSAGAIKKLKARICLRGNIMQQKGQWDTWCPIAGFRALPIFLAMAAWQQCRGFQLDFVGAFLQSNAVD
jgi:hypothetical protein